MSGKNKILLVEDDVFIHDIYEEKLKKDGFEVVSAENGREALKSLEQFMPDLIMLDVIMPYMNGLEFLAEIKKSEKWKNIPVLMMTNLSEKGEIEEAQKYGIADYLVKYHFTPAEVVSKIKILLAD